MTMTRPKLLLADDHRLVAQAIANYLQGECEIVGIVDDGLALIEAAKRLKPDVIVSDISMPVLGGMQALRRLQEEEIEAKIIFLTMYSEPEMVSQSLHEGVWGYLPKSSAGEELLTAIREVLQGRVYLSPLIARQFAASMADRTHQAAKSLTPRQEDVLRLIVDGLNVKQIAAELELSPRTVETHKYEMMHNLGIRSIAELVHYAIRHGLVAC